MVPAPWDFCLTVQEGALRAKHISTDTPAKGSLRTIVLRRDLQLKSTWRQSQCLRKQTERKAECNTKEHKQTECTGVLKGSRKWREGRELSSVQENGKSLSESRKTNGKILMSLVSQESAASPPCHWN